MTIKLANMGLRDSLMGKGVAYPLSTAPSGDIKGVSEEENIRNGLAFFLEFSVGERVMMEDYAPDLGEMLFEDVETVRTLAPVKIVEALKKFEPRIFKLEAKPIDQLSNDPRTVKIRIAYTIRSTGTKDSLIWAAPTNK